jgi:CHAT domain-containing protein
MGPAIAEKIRVDLLPARRYQCRMLASLPTRLLSILALSACLAAPSTGRPASDETVRPDRPAEYMIYQYPDTTLVLKLDVAEAEFSVQTFGPESALLESSGVPGRRIGPVFQQIDSAPRARQLMIEVTPKRSVRRSAIRLEVLQFAAGDRNTAKQLRGYQLFSVGVGTTHASDASTWASKAYSLRNAAGVFASLGMEEMRLWSEYFAAHLVLHQLNDPLMALELAGSVETGAGRAGYPEAQLAARTLGVEAVLRLAADSGDYHARAHELLAEVVTLAQQLGMEAEHGRALYQDGRVYEMQGESERALEQYRAAVEVTEGSGDGELLNEIRGTAAALYEEQGRASGAIAMLDDIAGNLASEEKESADLELALRLFEKGRLLNNTYRYDEAVTELSQALQLQGAGDATLWGPTGLELAWAYYSLGAVDEALALLERTLPLMASGANPDSLARAYGSLGTMRRQRSQFELAARAREQQGASIRNGRGRAEWLIESALDARAQDGPGSSRTEGLLQQALRSASGGVDPLAENRASLLLCLFRLERGPAAACDAAAAAASYEAISAGGIPWLAADAALLHARVLAQSARAAAARDRMERLIEDLHWYRRALPGVLGAWYVENRGELVREFLALTRSEGQGASLLLAMERVRILEAADYARPESRPLGAEEEESLRGLLWRRQDAAGADGERLAGEVRRRLAAARAESGLESTVPTAADLDRLLAGLGRSEALLSYYFDGRQTQALLARRGAVQAVDLPGGARVREQLEDLGDALRTRASASLGRQLDSVGRALLEPLARMLPDTIYLLPTGPLRSVPLEALRRDGGYVAEQHVVVNLASLDSLARRSLVLSRDFRDRVFLAGNPQEQGDPFSLEFRTSPEITAVTDRFVGPGLHIVQGVALQKHEFEDERFELAALVHLALAGTVDLDLPDRSRLLLAPDVAGRNDSRAFLAPVDVRGFDVAAQLVVLTGTAVAGPGQSPFDSRLAFVADFLEAGSAAVLVTLWPPGERIGADFASDFYGGLLDDAEIAEVLAATKRARITADPSTNLPYWASFQLFIR